MHRIDTSTATPDNRFTEGDPAIPLPATVVSADWLNAVQEELVAVVTGAGLELDKAENDQLRQAIGRGITAAKPGLATTTAPGLVQVGGGLSITAQGLLSVLTATMAQAGILRPDGITCAVEDGVLKVLQQNNNDMEAWRKSWIGVPRPWRGTELPDNHCWANGDFVAFADWPELKAVYEAGGFAGLLMAWEADKDAKAANLGQWRPDAMRPTGLFTPNLTGQFLRCWGPGAEEDAGAWHRDEIRNITGNFGSSFCRTGVDVSYAAPTGAFNMPASGYRVVLSNTTSLGVNGIDASLVVPTGAQNVPQHIWQPVIIYLGQPAQPEELA